MRQVVLVVTACVSLLVAVPTAEAAVPTGWTSTPRAYCRASDCIGGPPTVYRYQFVAYERSSRWVPHGMESLYGGFYGPTVYVHPQPYAAGWHWVWVPAWQNWYVMNDDYWR